MVIKHQLNYKVIWHPYLKLLLTNLNTEFKDKLKMSENDQKMSALDLRHAI